MVKNSEIRQTLKEYAFKLGLNNKETDNLLNYSDENMKSDFVLISFFDRKTSEEILPISFMPKPDNYLNIVFYFKQFNSNPGLNLVEPEFDKNFQRSGFTAVEISAIVE